MTKTITKISRGYIHREPRFFGRVRGENVHRIERGVSLLLGAGLVVLARGRRWRTRLGLSAAGSALISRAISGRSRVYRALGVSTV
ncbi:MAG TPA: YgaP-like transmembrane domain [Polyangia bacterium]|nr:YgaP-like transmembrane domain [Polyangia bacterium]